MHHFEIKCALVKCRFHKSVHGEGLALKVFTIFFILLIVNVTTLLISFYSAHHMISTTLLPAASRSTPSRQTARHPFSFRQSLLNKLDVVTNAPLRHVQLREASACCSPSGLCPVAPGVPSGAASRSRACSEDSVLPLLQPKGYFCFLRFFLPGYTTNSLLRGNTFPEKEEEKSLILLSYQTLIL